MATRRRTHFEAYTELPAELWLFVAPHLRTCHKWSLLGVCKDAFEAVVLVVEAPGGKRVFNREQAMAFVRVAVLGQSIWLTGKAGSGKSHVTRAVASAVAEDCGENTVAICAPTGTAARVASVGDLRGTTLHFGFNIRSRNRLPGDPLVQIDNGVVQGENVAAAMHEQETGEHVEGGDPNNAVGGAPTCVLDRPTRARLKTRKLLIIDETSMASSEMMDMVDSALKNLHSSNAPFGGVTVMAIADFFQLEPVMSQVDIARAGGKKWAFESDAWQHLRPVQLTQVVRQKDPEFAAVLNRMRVGQTTDQDTAWLKRASRKSGSGELAIFPSNAKCKRRNDDRLAAIDSPSVTISAVYSVVKATRLPDGGIEMHPLPPDRVRHHLLRWSSADIVKRGPNGEAATLQLKVGCRVRCIRNIYVGSYGLDRELDTSNGQLGTVTAIESDYTEDDGVRVLWDALGEAEARETVIRRVGWVRKQNFRVDDCTVYTVSRQVPLALAAAITIHSAQGGTFAQNLDVDPQGVQPVWPNGPNGQKVWVPKAASAYVAMSRATCISNVRILSSFSKRDVVADQFVLDYYMRVFGSV